MILYLRLKFVPLIPLSWYHPTDHNVTNRCTDSMNRVDNDSWGEQRHYHQQVNSPHQYQPCSTQPNRDNYIGGGRGVDVLSRLTASGRSREQRRVREQRKEISAGFVYPFSQSRDPLRILDNNGIMAEYKVSPNNVQRLYRLSSLTPGYIPV
ncbi:hypothetical protein Btru_067982 [Bulinus truncatus]|nr:hypothetical protein Btru_067982 [Bulinus truncatus]